VTPTDKPKALPFLEGVEQLCRIVGGTRVRGGLDWVKQYDMVAGKRKYMKHVSFRTSLNVMGCGTAMAFGIFLDRCRHLGVCSVST